VLARSCPRSKSQSEPARPQNSLSEIAVLATLLLVSSLASCAPSRSIEPVTTGDSIQKATGKSERVSGQLLSIYEQKYPTPELRARACSDLDRAKSDAANSVVVDATAMKDSALLLDQLTSIGLTHAQVAPPVVSGYLPICAIPQLEDCCSELRFVRESVSQLQKQ
jgi:hypothetical protein